MLRSVFSGLWTLRGLVMLLGLVALCLVVWFAGPLVAIGDYVPLGSEWTRSLVIAGLLGVILGVTLIRHGLAWRANRKIIKSLLDSETLGALTDQRSSGEVEIIRDRFEDAMRALEEAGNTAGNRRGYLAELPWYIIIGPPGAGKTTILKNSGLQFPLANRLGTDPVSGIGGTRHCDWWFTDRAVLIDTAGRYTTQDVNAEVDRAAWRGFLDILKQQRSRRPINGILLAISLADVLLRDDAERKRHVDALRRRLQELMKTFGMQLPVYVLITKADLVAGFSEYFDDLDEEGRRQVWGATFPLETAGDRIAESFGSAFGDLAQRLEDGLIERMHGEASLARRAAMFSFPKEFIGLRTAIGSFIHDVFRPSKFESIPLLRGVYFTSGTQEGTPIDRLIGVLSRFFGLQGSARPPFSGAGKAYFIETLLSDLVFAEQGIVGTDRKLERRMVAMHGFGYAAALTLVVGLGLLFFGAMTRSQAKIAETVQASSVATLRLGEAQRAAGLGGLQPALDAAVALKTASGEGSLWAWLDGIGLSATPSLAPAAQDAYDRALLSRLLPSLVERIGARVQSGLNYVSQADLNALRETLKVYLMMGDVGHFDKSEVAQAVRSEVSLAFPLDPQRRTGMADHVARLMELLPHPVEIDRRLVTTARGRLTREPRVDQVYQRLLREAAQSPRLHPIDLAGIVGSTSLQLVGGTGANSPSRSTIPGAFTRDAFYDFVLPRVPVLVREEQGADWVLAADQIGDATLQRVTRDVMSRYVADYVNVWQAGLNSVSAVRFDDLQRGLNVLQGLADPQSPLQRLIDTLRENTDLPPPTDAAPDKPGSAAAGVAASILPVSIAGAGKALASAAMTSAMGDMPWPGKAIGAPFQALLQFANPPGGTAQSQFGKVRDDFAKLFGTMSDVANAPEPRLAANQLLQNRVKDPTSDLFSNLRSLSAQSPAPVKTILRDVTNSSWAILLALTYDYVNSAWQREVVPVCAGALFERYPLFETGKDDVSLHDFGDMFRPGGIIDSFFSKYMSPLVTDQRNGFAAARLDGLVIPFKSESLAQFQRARLIRQSFFNGTGSAPGTKFSLRPIYLGPELLRSTLRADAQEIVYRHEPPRSFDLEWPTRSDASTVSVTLTKLDGTETKVDASGPWALFRLVDAAQIASRGASDRFTLTVGQAAETQVKYELHAGSVTNPFSLDALRRFRCPDAL